MTSALGRQRQVDFLVQVQPGLWNDFQDSQGYTEIPYLEGKKKQKTKTKQNTKNKKQKQKQNQNQNQNDFLKSADKWMEPDNSILCEVTQ